MTIFENFFFRQKIIFLLKILFEDFCVFFSPEKMSFVDFSNETNSSKSDTTEKSKKEKEFFSPLQK